jgi:hypothetical protein
MIHLRNGEQAKGEITAQSKIVYKTKETRGYLPGNDLGRWRGTKERMNGKRNGGMKHGRI